MAFRETFNCLWCGTAWTVRDEADLEGWAQLCPACLGRAGENGFLRFRLHQAIADRAAGLSDARPPAPDVAPEPGPAHGVAPAASPPAPAAPAPAPASAAARDLDDWYLRRGRHARGPIHDAGWQAELDAAGRWLDGLPIAGRIVELAGATGWWSPLLAARGELTVYDDDPTALDRARERLLAHGLRAHLHVRDPWAEPEPPPADALVTTLFLGRLEPDRLDAFARLARRWLRPGGTFAAIDALPDAAPLTAPQPGVTTPQPSDTPPDAPAARREPAAAGAGAPDPASMAAADLPASLRRAGFVAVEVTTTGRFLRLSRATAGPGEAS